MLQRSTVLSMIIKNILNEFSDTLIRTTTQARGLVVYESVANLHESFQVSSILMLCFLYGKHPLHHVQNTDIILTNEHSYLS
mgnify:FL=1